MIRIIQTFFFCCITIFSWSQIEDLELLGRWTDSTLVASNAHDNTYNEIWGIAINDHEFAVIGTTAGTHIIDVTDPTAPEHLHLIPGKTVGRQVVHRDYHDYGCYLYAVCDEGQSSLQIIDISKLPETVTVVYDDDKLINRSHNIFIDTTYAILYSLATRGEETGFGAVAVFTLEDPTKPTFVNNYQVFGDITASHVHDAYVTGGRAYFNCGRNGFAIVDFRDVENPTTLATLRPNEYPQAGYNHSGWTNDAGTHYYMADENHGFDIKTVNIEDLNNVTTEGTFNAQSSSALSIPHNPIAMCDYLYVSYYYDGVRIFDITDPADPVLTHKYATSELENKQQYRGAWGVYPFLPSGTLLASDMQNGLFIFKGVQQGCGNYAACHKIVSGLDDKKERQFGIYPNPASDELIIDVINGISKSLSFEITNIQGQKVETGRLSSNVTTINVSHLDQGMYYIHFHGKTISQVETFLIER